MLDAANYSSLLDKALKPVSPCQDLAPGVLDPFSSMSLLITPRLQMLMHHYFNERLASSWLMMPMRKGLLSLAMADEALFHTVIPHYIARFNIRFRKGVSEEILYHKTQAIRIVNERLKDPTQALTDATIATVANMATLESSNGTLSSLSVHINGLVELVKMRGGLENGGFVPFVKRLVGWQISLPEISNLELSDMIIHIRTDWHAANALSTELRMPPLNLLGSPRRDISTTQVLQATAFDSFNVPSSLDTVEQADHLDHLLEELRELSWMMQAIRTSKVDPQEDIWYSDKIYHLQRSLYEIIHPPSHDSSLQDIACAMAGLIYCAHCLRDMPLNLGVNAKGIARLKTAIETSQAQDTYSMNTRSLKRLFWVLGFGGTVSEGMPERPWFVAEFWKHCAILHLSDIDSAWETARSVLDGVLWHYCLDEASKRFLVEAKSGIT